MLNLLIVDGMDGFRSILADLLSEEYRVSQCRTGREALSMIQKSCPDILMLDLMLPDLDGMTLLQTIDEQGYHPMILATSRLMNDYIITYANKYKVSYLMLKPVQMDAVAARLRDFSETLAGPKPAEDDRSAITSLLLSLGFSPKLLGFDFLKEAIISMSQAPKQSITKELYPTVAGICNSNTAQVERCIRSAIGAAYLKREETEWKSLLPNFSARPSNAVFICAVTQLLGRSPQK